MDKNRLIQIANHFDKIGAYTVSDEFENKFIRTAAPADEKLFSRDPRITKRSEQTLPKKVLDFFTDFRKNFNLTVRSPDDVFQFNQNSWNLITTWIEVFYEFSRNTIYTSDPKKLKLINDISREIFLAEINFKAAKPSSVRSGESHKGKKAEILGFANAEQTLLQLFVKFVDLENEKYGNANSSKYHPYLNNLRKAEALLYNLDALSSNSTPIPVPGTTPTTPTTPPTPAPTPPAPTPPVTTPPVTTIPATAPGGRSTTPPGGSSSGGTEPKKPNKGNSGSKPSKKPGTVEVTDSSTVLANIVLKLYRGVYPEENKEDVIFGMRTIGSLVLPTYLKISKNKSLDESIRKAIQDSNYTPGSKAKILKLYELKLKTAVEAETTKPTGTSDTGSADTSVTGPTGAQPPTNSGNTQSGTGSSYTLNFTCNREGLLREIQRVEDKSTSDVDQFARDYFTDIYRITECHSKIRPSLVHEDNIYIDVKISQLRTRYFSYINRTQFPY